MMAAIESGRRKTPWHLWVVALASLAWNAFGCLDYTMTNLRDPDYLAQVPAETMQAIDSFPVWATAGWALGVWGALAGSLLLLPRSRFAFHAFALSLAGLAVSSLYQWTADLPESMTGGGMAVMQGAIWAVAVLLLIYVWRMRAARVLG